MSRTVVCAPATTDAETITAASAAHARLAQLRIDLLEIPRIDEYLARLAARRGRHEALGLHHVHQASRATEPDPQATLEIRNRRLAARYDDARRLVVQVV